MTIGLNERVKVMSFSGITDIGLKRKNNQDYFRTATIGQAEIAVLCDGMGGAAGGAVASKLAADSFLECIENNPDALFEPEKIRDILLQAGNAAHMSVYNCANEFIELDGIGTTLVACIYKDDILYIINAGDSRLYTIKNDLLQKQTKDHSLIQDLLDKGVITEEQAKNHPYKNYIMRALGTETILRYDYFECKSDFDYVLLCSDGLYNFVTDEEMLNIIYSEKSIEEKTALLVDAANKGGGGDNITAVLLSKVLNDRKVL